jgi:MFS family permease
MAGWMGRLRSVARQDFARACGAVLLLNAADASVTTIAPPYLQALGLPLSSIGLLLAVYAVTSLLSRLPAGRLADGRQARRWFMAGCLVLSASLALYPVAVEAWAFAAVRGVHGLAFGAATTLNLAAVLATEGRGRARAMALYTGAMAGGFTVGNLLGGVLADGLGYRTTFLVSAAFPLLATLLGTRTAEVRVAPRAPGGLGLRVLLHRQVRGVLVLSVAINLLHQTWGTLFPLYVIGAGAGVSLAGGVRAMHSFTNTLARPLGEPVVRRFGPTGLACFGLVLYGAGIASLPLTTFAPVLLVLAAVIGAGRASAYLANVVTTAELSEHRVVNRGTASALITLGGDVGAIVAPVVAGALASHVGIGLALQGLAVAVTLGGLVGVLSSRTAAASTSSARSRGSSRLVARVT